MACADISLIPSNMKGSEAKRSNSDGSKSASELYDTFRGAAVIEKDLPKGDLPYEPVTEVDKKDVGTPDQWIARHPDLIRLTGRCASWDFPHATLSTA